MLLFDPSVTENTPSAIQTSSLRKDEGSAIRARLYEAMIFEVVISWGAATRGHRGQSEFQLGAGCVLCGLTQICLLATSTRSLEDSSGASGVAVRSGVLQHHADSERSECEW